MALSLLKLYHKDESASMDLYKALYRSPLSHHLNFYNNGNYSPDNCRWADLKTQGRNKSNNWNITFMGKTRTLAEWAEITGLKANCIGMRLKKYGWSVERALTEKSHRVYKLKK